MPTLLALIVAQLFTAHGPFTIGAGSRLWIEGDSNFKAWSCEARQAEASLDLQAAKGTTALAVRVPIAGFHCNDDMLDGKLREALKADRYPDIGFFLESQQLLPGTPAHLRVTGSLMLAGQTGTVSFLAEIVPSRDGAFVARGSVPVLMTSYDVEPPTAMLGLVKADDRVTVNFEIRASRIAGGARVSRREH